MGCITGENEENQAPVVIRGCTDVFWLILYITFWLLMVRIYKKKKKKHLSSLN